MNKSAELRAKALEIEEKAKQEGRDLTAEENQEIDRLLAEANTAEEQEKAEADKAARTQALEDARRKMAAPQPRPTADAKNVVPGKDDDAKAGSNPLLPDGIAATSGVRDMFAEDLNCGFKSYNEFASVVRGMVLKGGMDDRFDKMATIYGANTIVGEDGGFLIPPNFSNRMYERMMTEIPILADCDKIVLTNGNEITITGVQDHDRNSSTYRYGGIVVYRVAEGDALTLSQLKWRKVKIGLDKVGALCAATNEELADVPGYGDRLLNKMADAVGDFMVEDVMWGNGAGQPLGAWASNACISVAKETGQLADSIDLQNVYKMGDNLWEKSEAKAKFYYNRECRTPLRGLKETVGTGGELVKLFERGAPGSGSPDRLDGYPAYSTEHCEALGDSGDLVLGDMTQYALATKGTPQMAQSMHLYFTSMQQAFRVDFRYGGKPLWDKSLRPRKGASTKRVSPWVKLDERA